MLRALPATKGFALLPRENRPARTIHVSEQKPSEDERLKGREGTGPLLPEALCGVSGHPGFRGKKEGSEGPISKPSWSWWGSRLQAEPAQGPNAATGTSAPSSPLLVPVGSA